MLTGLGVEVVDARLRGHDGVGWGWFALARRAPVVESLMTRTEEMSALDDRTLQFRLKKPFALLPFALTAVFIMPERIAKTDAFTMINEHVGSGPYNTNPPKD